MDLKKKVHIFRIILCVQLINKNACMLDQHKSE